MLKSLDGACDGEEIAVNGVLRNLHQVQKVVKAFAADKWFEECRLEAELTLPLFSASHS